jgi:predicted secreted protein
MRKQLGSYKARIVLGSCFAIIVLVAVLIVIHTRTRVKEASMRTPTQIELKVGEEYTLRLTGLGSAGYMWGYTLTDDDKAVRVSAPPASQPSQTGGPPPIAFSADALFTIQALKPGHVTIRFALRRPWETQTPPLQEYFVEVTVNP